MIRETLSAIGLASGQVLKKRLSVDDLQTQVTQVREWSFVMPYLSRVTVANSPVHQIYVGLSRELVPHLGASSAELQAAHEGMLEELKNALLARLPAKRPIVSWNILQPDDNPRMLRGVRSFILRHQSHLGNLYLMADLASRREYESLRNPAWEEELTRQMLPDIGSIDCIENQAMLDRVATYLARCEHDLELLIPSESGDVHKVSGVVVKHRHGDGNSCLELSLDLDRRSGVELRPGLELEGAFGAAGRLFRFRTKCLGSSNLNLGGVGSLRCQSFAIPSRVHLDQRRRYFRVAPEDELTARVELLTDADAAASAPSEAPEPATAAMVADLSFSGAGLIVASELTNSMPLGAQVRIWLSGPELQSDLVVCGVVRRHVVVPRGRGRDEMQLGIEFQAGGTAGRQAVQAVRQYVMGRQRSLLTVRSRDPEGIAT